MQEFEGYVMSDWGAVNERVPGLAAGLDLEMPSSGGIGDREIVKAVMDGTLEEEILDRTVERILQVAEAIEAAKNAEKAIVFAGLPDSFESEGYDRKHMRLPACQNRLIMEIANVQPNLVVVLHNGSPVEMPWLDATKAVLETYLGGQAGGNAAADILYGKVNPSGKLAESFPIKLQDNPSYLNFGEAVTIEYREGLYVGYRYYDAKAMDVAFPFGHGLSYTKFAYSGLRLSTDKITEKDTLKVFVDVTNTGAVKGKEIVQIYVKLVSEKF